MIAAGFGFRGSATMQSLRAAFDLAASGQVVACLATAQDKAQADCLTALADELRLPIQPIAAATIRTIPTLTHSPQVERLRNTGSLAEACALAAAGPGARLISARHASPDGMATCALATSAPVTGLST